MRTTDRLALAADLGATKTTLALYDQAAWPGPPLRRQTYRNADFADFDLVLDDFLGEHGTRPEAACLGIAGPVVDQKVQMTNLAWSISARDLKTRFGLPRAELINDLVATALGAMQLPAEDLIVINAGTPAPGAALGVIAPGSGLGEAFLVSHTNSLIPCATEGGHASFAPRNPEQLALLAELLSSQGHVSVEQVCSGLAVPALFRFMSDRHPTPDWLEAELAGKASAQQTPLIVQAALAAQRGERPCEVALATMGLLLDILADEAANLALKTLARGGMFLGGGLMARLAPLLDRRRFMEIFARGAYAEMLGRIPVRLITNPHTALLGAATRAMDLLAAPAS